MPRIEIKKSEIAFRFGIFLGLLVAAGGFLYGVAVDTFATAQWTIIGVGMAITVLSAIGARKWIASAFFTKKTLIGANVGVTIVLVLVIAGSVAYISNRRYKRIDYTNKRFYSLSSKSIAVARGLKKDVIVTTLFQPNYRWAPQINDMLEEYAANSSHIVIKHIDPVREPAKAQLFLKQLKIESAELNSVIFQCGDKSKHVTSSEMVEEPIRNPYMPQPQSSAKIKAEEAFTAALISVTEEKQPTVYFVYGHGERTTDNYQSSGLSDLATLLKRDNYKVEKLNLVVKEEVPSDCDLLVIPAPKKKLTKDEIDALKAYLEQNKPLIVCLEPSVMTHGTAGLTDFLKKYKIKVREDVVVIDKLRNPFTGQMMPTLDLVLRDYPYHAITQPMKSMVTLFSGACLVDAITSGGRPSGGDKYSATSIIKTDDKGWGETNVTQGTKYDPAEDIKGPISVAVAAEPSAPPCTPYGPPPSEKPEGARLVVFGDVDFISNALINKFGNRSLFMNAVNWAAKKETHLGIEPKTVEMEKASLTPTSRRVIFIVTVIVMPAVWILLGIVVASLRRLS